jgi:mono/diheme cytochrome c family protein
MLLKVSKYIESLPGQQPAFWFVTTITSLQYSIFFPKKTPALHFQSNKFYFMRSKKNTCTSLKIFTIAISLLLYYNSTEAQSKWVVPQAAASIKNPLANDAESIKTGRTLYKTQCSPCHGDMGKGDGPAAAALTPKPADHTSKIFQAESDGSLFYKISEGRKPMPAFKNSLNENQRWALINYIRTLSKK